jgi:hypothetical protein
LGVPRGASNNFAAPLDGCPIPINTPIMSRPNVVGCPIESVPQRSLDAFAAYAAKRDADDAQLAADAAAAGLSKMALRLIRRVGEDKARAMMPHLFA